MYIVHECILNPSQHANPTTFPLQSFKKNPNRSYLDLQRAAVVSCTLHLHKTALSTSLSRTGCLCLKRQQWTTQWPCNRSDICIAGFIFIKGENNMQNRRSIMFYLMGTPISHHVNAQHKQKRRRFTFTAVFALNKASRLTVSRVVCFDHGCRRHVPQVNTSCVELTHSAMNSSYISPHTEGEEPVRLCLCLFK